MTKKDKELLRDLCSRLPYGIILDIDTTDWEAPQGHIKLKIEGLGILFKDMSLIVNGSYYGNKYKPYLRPMSSMTDEEIREFTRFTSISQHRFFIGDSYFWYNTYEEEDWLNAHHFDYRGLIDKGLAIEAPEGMYN